MTRPVAPAFALPVVVGVAEDGRSDVAVQAALQWSAWFGAPPWLVHGTVPRRALLGSPREDEARAHVEAVARLLGAHVDTLGAEAHDGLLSSRLRVRPQRADAAIVDVAREVGAGLIVVGKHRRRGVLDLGDTARAILGQAPCPVWCQHEAPADKTLERILVPVDFSRTSEDALAWALLLADALGARLRVLHAFCAPVLAYAPAYGAVPPTYVVDEEREGARKALHEFGARHGVTAAGHELLFVECDPHDAILQHENEADLVVLGTHGRTGVRAALLGSVAHGVLREAHRPVVAVPSRSREE